MSVFIHDVRYGLRMLRKTPGFTAVVVLTLALGIGANTAIFSLINALMLKGLPVNDPQQLVALNWTGDKLDVQNSGYGDGSFSYPVFEQLRARSRTVSLFGFARLGFDPYCVNISTDGQTSLAAGEMVTGNFFSVLGVTPVLGRTITESDVNSTGARAAVISYAYWSKLGRNQAVIGKNIALNGVPFTIVGVAPAGFFGVAPGWAPDVWIPITDHAFLRPWGSRRELQGGAIQNAEQWWWLALMGRRKPGVTEAQAQAELDVLAQQSVRAALNPGTTEADRLHIHVKPAGQGLEYLRSQLRQPVTVLMILVGLLLLIACANVATLLLARATARQREVGVRVALGATRGRLIRQLLTESILLAGLGGLLGLLFAGWGTGTLIALFGGQDLRLEAPLDVTVLGFTAAVSLVTGILFGLAPLLPVLSIGLAPTLKNNVPAIAGTRRRLSAGRLLVALQVAVSLLLLISAGLFLRTLQKLQAQNFGFDQRQVLLFQLDPTRNGYEGDRRVTLFTQVLERLQALPGVSSATLSRLSLLSGWVSNEDIIIPGYTPKSGERMLIDANAVGPDFFKTMGIRLLAGRGVEWRDTASAPAVAVVNQAFARRFFGTASPLGQHLRFDTKDAVQRDFEIVGVAADAKFDSARRQARATAYVPYTQTHEMTSAFFELRATGDPAALATSVRAAVRDLDPQLPLLNLRTQTEQIDELLSQERLFARLSSFFGGLGLLLACIGLHGTMSYAVSRRTTEIGVRMALGAPRSQVLWMVLRQSLIIVALGVAAGIPLALAATRVGGSMISGLLFGIKALDPMTIVAASGLLLVVAALAGYLPARRASNVDPMVALRYE